MNRKHLPFIVLAMMIITSIAAGCGKGETDEPTPTPTPVDTDTIVTPVDTDTVVIPIDSTVYIKWSGTTASVEVDEKLADDSWGNKPIFVLCHVPVHYSMRTETSNNAKTARPMVDVLNDAGGALQFVNAELYCIRQFCYDERIITHLRESL